MKPAISLGIVLNNGSEHNTEPNDEYRGKWSRYKFWSLLYESQSQDLYKLKTNVRKLVYEVQRNRRTNMKDGNAIVGFRFILFTTTKKVITILYSVQCKVCCFLDMSKLNEGNILIQKEGSNST